MTNTDNDDGGSPSTSRVSWRPIQAGLWVGSDDRGTVGLVTELWTKGFTATTAAGEDLGLHSTAAAARRAVEEALDRPPR